MKTISKILVVALALVSISVNANAEGEIISTVNSVSAATSLTVTGQVVDKLTGEALVGVAVKIENVTIYTDFDGNFSATIGNANTVLINVNLISYCPQEFKVERNNLSRVKLELNPIKE